MKITIMANDIAGLLEGCRVWSNVFEEDLGLVPPSGVEPELPKEPDFESGASTNSAKGADQEELYHSPIAPPGWQNKETTLPDYTQLTVADVMYGRNPSFHAESAEWKMAQRLDDLEDALLLPYDWEAVFTFDTRGYWYLQIKDPCPTCNVTGKPIDAWTGRKWLLSPHMTDGEIVQTVFMAAMTAVEHETRETFFYKGQAIFDPHYDIDKLAAFRSLEGSIKGREEAA